MNSWYTFEPVDTLFFRGSEPMIMGENHTSNFNFPPPAHTIEGAIRTYFYHLDKKGYSEIIRLGEKKGSFNVIGPFFKEDGKIFVPAPYSWFIEKQEEKTDTENESKVTKVIKSYKVSTNLIQTSNNETYWVKPSEKDVETLGGRWLLLSDLISNKEKVEVRNSSDFFVQEYRTGIALEKNRKVREGHIYAFVHARLKEKVSIVFGIDKDLPLEHSVTITLGAEQRFGKLKRIANNINFENDGSMYMNLSIFEANDEANKHIVATGKPLYLGGWDLAKGFHKPMRGFFPAGSVFTKKLDNNFINI
ncbi:hypothetical protein LF845_09750 [Deferribacterales bacterium Es71-Z0220]|uniref:type III-B CRISPR module-associated Cmr3 family protein n=1 Tax=Deferrivibrio essentukiensis TaxID=2880922 RepID=UPI001F60AE95|nr:hypothetical protein [Deferrivibrio essentukiensis]